jgi:aspartate aminotransferase
MHYAEGLDNLGTETALEVLKRIQNFPEKRRNNIISFAKGEPDFPTLDHIKKAGIKAIEENFTHYSSSA